MKKIYLRLLSYFFFILFTPFVFVSLAFAAVEVTDEGGYLQIVDGDDTYDLNLNDAGEYVITGSEGQTTLTEGNDVHIGDAVIGVDGNNIANVTGAGGESLGTMYRSADDVLMVNYQIYTPQDDNGNYALDPSQVAGKENGFVNTETETKISDDSIDINSNKTNANKTGDDLPTNRIGDISASSCGDLSGEGISAITNNIICSVQNTPILISTLSYLASLLMAVLGVVKMKEYVENPERESMLKVFVIFVCAGLFLATPTLYEAMANSISGGEEISSYEVKPRKLYSEDFGGS